jgi:hypothetical protein
MSLHIARSANVPNILFGSSFAERSARSKFRRNMSEDLFYEIKRYLNNILLPEERKNKFYQELSFLNYICKKGVTGSKPISTLAHVWRPCSILLKQRWKTALFKFATRNQ